MSSAREETVRLSELLRREHHALAEFLIALAAFDRERRWVELGYPSLFSFLTRELRLSAGAAQYRKTAAELIQRYPEVEDALRRGDLCLTSVIEVAKVLTAENAAEVLPRFFGKSARDAAVVAASIRPVQDPPVREFLVTSVPSGPGEAVPGDVTTGVFRAPEVAPPVAAPPPALLAGGPAPAPDRPKVRPLDAERARVSMTVSRRLLDKLAAARDALSHSHPSASEETILELGLDLILERQARRRGLVKKPRSTAPASPDPESADEPSSDAPRTRYVPAAVKRAVFVRDQGRCQWPVEGGGVCGATLRVQLDHVRAFARGGRSAVGDLRCLCAVHNDLHARQVFGDAWMDRFVRPKTPRCSEPLAVYAAAPAAPTPSARARRRRAGPAPGSARRPSPSLRCRTPCRGRPRSGRTAAPP